MMRWTKLTVYCYVIVFAVQIFVESRKIIEIHLQNITDCEFQDLGVGVALQAYDNGSHTYCELPEKANSGIHSDVFCETCIHSSQISNNDNRFDITIINKTLSSYPKDFDNYFFPLYIYMYAESWETFNKYNPHEEQIYTGCVTFDSFKLQSLTLTNNMGSLNVTLTLGYVCSRNYYGDNCDVYCKPPDNTSGHYKCDRNGTKVCLPDYFGDNCTRYDFCSLTPCFNNGSCVNTQDGFQCYCLEGFSGHNCSINNDDCSEHVCNNGSCVDGINSYSCVCDPDYTGRFCNISINDCENHKCNHGQCIDGIANYTCNCLDGYTGSFCNHSINDCEDHKCINGTCVDGLNNYTCTCLPDFTGQFCDIGMPVDNETPLRTTEHSSNDPTIQSSPFSVSSTSSTISFIFTPPNSSANSSSTERFLQTTKGKLVIGGSCLLVLTIIIVIASILINRRRQNNAEKERTRENMHIWDISRNTSKAPLPVQSTYREQSKVENGNVYTDNISNDHSESQTYHF